MITRGKCLNLSSNSLNSFFKENVQRSVWRICNWIMELSRFKQQAAKAFTRLSLYKPLFGKSAGAPPTERAAEIEPKLFTSSKGFQNLCFRHILYHLLTTQWRILGARPPYVQTKVRPEKKIFFFVFGLKRSNDFQAIVSFFVCEIL